ncbi:uncharacterized protein [Diabrotica undecimpunctata]|uniref:uncharacterized protein n=1 Tax=Diabrotica undecimpunctata TaxID=50387 RepID=UPI003B638C6F
MESSVVQYLKNSEVDYELFIRGVKTKKSISEKKTMLRKLLNKNAVINLDENRLNFEEERIQIDLASSDIRVLIDEFEGDISDSVYRRAKAHLSHLSLRISRLPVEFDEEIEYKNEASANCLLLEGELDDKIISGQPSTSSNVVSPQPVVNIPAPIVQVSHPINLADWNVKFNGDAKSVFPFLEKVRDLAESRNIDHTILFRSAVELFSGSAAVWFRSIRGTVSSWNDIICLLKATFLPHDYDEDLWNQIKSRKQKKSEPFALFQAQIMALAKRLTTQPLEKILVPKPQREGVIKSCHDPATCAHPGVYKTLARIQERYYWPKMREDVVSYVRACKICGAQKAPNTAQMGKMGKEKKAEYPWQIIAVDLIGPLTRSKNGFTWLLVCADWFSKYTLLHPLRKATASNICKFLEEQVFLMFGVPQHLMCDNASNLNCNIMKDLCKRYDVQKIWFSAVYSPQVNFVERNNRTIGTAIRSYIDNHRDWDKHIHEIRQAINTAKHEVTQYTPAFLNFARHVPLSGNYYGQVPNDPADIEILPGDRNSYASEVKGLTEVFSVVRRNLSRAYERNAKTYNLRKRDVQFNVGDQVWRKNMVLSSAPKHFMAKLAPKYILCTVIKKLSPLVYVLRNPDGSNAGNWHIKDLKAYQPVSISSDNSDLSETE